MKVGLFITWKQYYSEYLKAFHWCSGFINYLEIIDIEKEHQIARNDQQEAREEHVANVIRGLVFEGQNNLKRIST